MNLSAEREEYTGLARIVGPMIGVNLFYGGADRPLWLVKALNLTS